MRSLVGATCGPRIPTFFRRLSGRTSWAGLNFFMSAARISLTSPLLSTSFFVLGISSHLSVIRLSQTDHAYAIVGLGEAHDVDARIERTDGDIAYFAVVVPAVDVDERLIENESRGCFKGELTLADIPFVLAWVEVDEHKSECTYNLTRRLATLSPVRVVGPNVEVTGRRRRGAWAARRNMDNERLAAQVPCRWRSG
jgi:hypothetical protein